MGKRQVSILQTAATAVAEIAFFIENKGLPVSAKKFTDEAFQFLTLLQMIGLNTENVFIKNGGDWITDVLLTRKNTPLLL